MEKAAQGGSEAILPWYFGNSDRCSSKQPHLKLELALLWAEAGPADSTVPSNLNFLCFCLTLDCLEHYSRFTSFFSCILTLPCIANIDSKGWGDTTQLSLLLQQQCFNCLQVLGRQGDSTRYRKKRPTSTSRGTVCKENAKHSDRILYSFEADVDL